MKHSEVNYQADQVQQSRRKEVQTSLSRAGEASATSNSAM
jgi:hypothetical protein